MVRTYANVHNFSSIRNFNEKNRPFVPFATQLKKKTRAPIACLLDNVYVNIPVVPPKPVHVSNEVTYATLLNTSSALLSATSTDPPVSHAEYQQIQIQSKGEKTDTRRIYENVKSRRPPPPPCYAKRPPVVPPVETDESVSCSENVSKRTLPPRRTHLYINMKQAQDQPPAIPTRVSKPAPVVADPALPPAIPPRREQKQEDSCATSNAVASSIQTEQEERETNAAETCSNASTVRVGCSLTYLSYPHLLAPLHLDCERTRGEHGSELW